MFRCPKCCTKVNCPHHPSIIMTFKTVRRGMLLVDQFGQRCKVESRSLKCKTVMTQRTDDPTIDQCALWTPEEFDARQFMLVRS